MISFNFIYLVLRFIVFMCVFCLFNCVFCLFNWSKYTFSLSQGGGLSGRFGHWMKQKVRNFI